MRRKEIINGLYETQPKPRNPANDSVDIATAGEVRATVPTMPSRKRPSPLHAGLTLAAENRAFMVAAMLWLLVSAVMLAWNGTLLTDSAARPAQLHVFTVGFVLSLVYGLAAHMLPHFTGNPIRGRTWAWLQFALLETGLALFVVGFVVEVHAAALTGAVLLWLSIVLFTVRLWPVLWPRHTDKSHTQRLQLRAPQARN